jgi:acyl dehydratase
VSTDKRYAYEDFTVGRVFEFGGMTVVRDDIVRFAAEFDPQPLHLSEEAAAKALFKKLSASGWHTCAMVMRMICDGYLLDSTSLGSPGVEQLKWTRPVFAGDTLRVRVTVLEARPMKSKPHIGLVRSRSEALNQHDEVVLEMQAWGMFGRRDVVPPG